MQKHLEMIQDLVDKIEKDVSMMSISFLYQIPLTFHLGIFNDCLKVLWEIP